MSKTLLTGVATLALFAGAANAADLKFPVGDDSRFNWDSYNQFAEDHGDLKGQTLSIFGPWLGPDKDLIESVLAYFEEATGANVEYSGSDSFEQQIVIDTQAGSPPNIAVFPQPGLAADLASKGLLTKLPASAGEFLAENYAAGESWVDLSSYAGKDGEKALYAFPYKADVKSLVWRPSAALSAGLAAPSVGVWRKRELNMGMPFISCARPLRCLNIGLAEAARNAGIAPKPRLQSF